MVASENPRNCCCNCFNIASVAGVQNSPGANPCVNKESLKLIDTQMAEIGPLSQRVKKETPS
jgi:hypothetical protein